MRVRTPDSLLISGMGELHLEIIIDRLKREYGVEVQTGKPQVVYKETIESTGKAHVVFAREIHDAHHRGEVTLAVAPASRGEGFVFQTADGLKEALSEEMIGHVEQSTREATLAGALAGHEVVDITVNFEAVGDDPLSMTGLGLKVAASQACKEACEKASPRLLEPYMTVEVVAPDEFVGEIIADLNSRHGRLEEVIPRGKNFSGQGCCAAHHHVRLFDFLAVAQSGTRHFHHEILPLRHKSVDSTARPFHSTLPTLGQELSQDTPCNSAQTNLHARAPGTSEQ